MTKSQKPSKPRARPAAVSVTPTKKPRARSGSESPAHNPFRPAPYEEPEVLSTEEVEATLIAGVLEGASVEQAGQRAGLEARSSQEVMERPHVRSALLQVLESKGVNDALLARVIRSGLHARHRATVSREGTVTLAGPDHMARHKYLTTVLALKDAEQGGGEDTWESMVMMIAAKRRARRAGE